MGSYLPDVNAMFPSAVERPARRGEIRSDMGLQALTWPCEAAEGFSAAATVREAIGVLGFNCQGLHAISLGREDVYRMNVKLLPHPDRQGEEDVDGGGHF
jgi:hypothetical protein